MQVTYEESCRCGGKVKVQCARSDVDMVLTSFRDAHSACRGAAPTVLPTVLPSVPTTYQTYPTYPTVWHGVIPPPPRVGVVDLTLGGDTKDEAECR